MNRNNIIETEEQLRELYEAPMERAILKQKSELDKPSKEFIQHSPFLVLSTISPDGFGDCSPKGDPEGFVEIIDDKTIAIPDRKGNNRLDSLVNITRDPRVGIIFFIPGRNETLRVNGNASISVDPELLSRLSMQNKTPKVAIIVDVKEAYFHCPKALIRSDFWIKGANLKDLTTYIKAAKEQLGEDVTKEEISKLAKEYQESLKDRLY